MYKKLSFLIAIASLLTLLVPSLNTTKAVDLVPGTNIPVIPVLKSDKSNLYFHTNFRYYPKEVNTTEGLIELRDRSINCTESKTTPKYKTIPWQGFYKSGTVTKVSNETANDMYAVGDCTEYYQNGGVGTVSKGWMPPEFYGGWAQKGVKKVGDFAYKSADTDINWDNIEDYIQGDAIYSDKFATVPTALRDASYISGVGTLTAQDSATRLFQDNGYTGWKNATGEKLLSNGTTYIRNQFNLTEEQINSIKQFKIDYQADDFVAVYLNGYQIWDDGKAPVDSTMSTYDSAAPNVTPTAQIKSLLSSTETNVLAFQLNDKATWVTGADATTTSNSNRTGIRYVAKFVQESITEPTASCAVSVVPSTGNSPLALEVKVRTVSGTLTNSWNISVTGPVAQSKNGVTSPAYFNLPQKGDYTVAASHTSGVNCGAGVVVNVKDPTSGSGNETNP